MTAVVSGPLADPGVVPWPAEFAARYRAAGYWRDRPLGDWLWDWAGEYADRVAIVDGAARLSFAELAGRADAVAVALRDNGLRRGDRIVVQLPNSWEFVVLLLGCLRAGVAPVLALPAHREHELDYLLRHTEARLLVVPAVWRGFDHPAMAAKLVAGLPWGCRVVVHGDGVDPAHLDLGEWVSGSLGRRAALDADRPHPDDVALFLLSGGTTGLPKLIGRTHNDYEYNVRCSAEVCAFGELTVSLIVLPLGHNVVLGCPGLLGTLRGGGRVVLLPSPEPRAALAAIAAHGVTDVAVVPAVAQRWIEVAVTEPVDLTSLRSVIIGGSVVDPLLVRDISTVLGGRPVQLFGMAEGLLSCTRPGDPDTVVFHTQGRPVSPGDELLVVDENDRPVPNGQPGELLTRGPYTPRGYYRAEEHNARAFTPDGWFRTGDIVRLHPGGNLTVEGRRKDLINRGGEKISAEEVESLARALLPVADAVAVPVPDRRLGERVCLVMVPLPDKDFPSLDEVRTRFSGHGVAHYKLPEQIEALSELPLTPIGKVDRKSIRARFAQEIR
jgi:2,3-dihydroxybenzoate-AMP ligase